MNSAAEADKVGVKVALNGRFDGGNLLLIILTIAATTGILILIDTRVSPMVPQNNSRWYARHILTFPAQRATCPAWPVQYRAVQKKLVNMKSSSICINNGKKKDINMPASRQAAHHEHR